MYLKEIEYRYNHRQEYRAFALLALINLDECGLDKYVQYEGNVTKNPGIKPAGDNIAMKMNQYLKVTKTLEQFPLCADTCSVHP